MRQLKWCLLASYLAACIIAWPKLPRRIPIHFNSHGIVDRWVDTGLTTWFLLPAVLVATIMLMKITTRLTTNRPHLWNLPEKQRFLRMTDEQRAPIYDELRAFMDVLSCAMIVLFAGIQYIMFATATRGTSDNPGSLLPFLTVAFSALVIGYAIRLNIRIRRIIRASSAGAPTGQAR